ncbi:hypothetical protein BJ138DRAFT_1116430 [Hygrophoropsis aurantiaca]|uniref:Uncharacterized protein n=1 Tax=Hygrophoropsis aurantiaca TaxID=72124 RepID=A0ACB8A3I3_9AGAM|nr:hypothetical protein BJ138DRAFT_1116430 [Hygrophoropsis aurantiaca]
MPLDVLGFREVEQMTARIWGLRTIVNARDPRTTAGHVPLITHARPDLRRTLHPPPAIPLSPSLTVSLSMALRVTGA